ncbi:MAG: ABC transporter permease [Peptostreptococcaceae bacterium]|jgi:ABC-2 type transport system permease protein|nr:ABC transporter permease [Peptostreptococcaceae bacterium]
MNFTRFFAIVKKEFIHIKRDKPSLIIAIMMPLMFILLFGYAVNSDLSNIKIAILDMDKTSNSKELVDKFKTSNYFIVDNYLKNIDDLEIMIKENKIKAGLIIPKGFYKKNLNKSIQFIIDGVDPTTAKTALQSGLLIIQDYNFKIVTKNKKLLSNINQIDIRPKVYYNPNLKSSNFTIPGLIGLIMQNITVMLTAFSLVREKENGTMELLIVTPIKSLELILGKMVPYILIGSIDFLIALSFGTFWFDVPIRGNLFLLLGLGLLFVICSLSIGMLISTVAKTQGQAMQMSIIIILPSVLLSGFVFPREEMIAPIKMLGNVIPLTYFLNILRGIILKNSTLINLRFDILNLSIITFVLLFLASIKFKKTLS